MKNTFFNKKLLFIGSGNIASAVACGLVNNGAVDPKNITVYNRNDKKFQQFKALGINTSLCLEECAIDADVIFLAVKPNVIKSVMSQLADISGALDAKLVVSFAASVSVNFIQESARREVDVIRTMPSTPILIGQGVLTVARNETISPVLFKDFCSLMSNIAFVSVIDEADMNAIISVQGSSPAYVYLFVKAMADAAADQGIDRSIALPLILKTIKGSIGMIEKCDTSLEQLISNVASPNGTTLAALNSFEKDDFCGTIDRAMIACTRRADEISNEL